MKTNFMRTAEWLAACGKEPTPANASVQLGCLLEEVAELIASVGTGNSLTDGILTGLESQLSMVGGYLKSGDLQIRAANREAVLDALCDICVTADGTAYLMGMNKDKADQLVLDSNDAKLVDGKPVILYGGKIGKPNGWKSPDLGECV